MGWLKRFFGGEREQSASQRAPAAGKGAPAARKGAPARADAVPPKPKALPQGFGALQPLVAANGQIAGFEFELPKRRVRTDSEASESARPDGDGASESVPVAARAIALVHAMRPTVESGRIALATLPAAMLDRPQILDRAMPGMMIAVAETSLLDAKTVAASRPAIEKARAKGIKIGLPAAVVASGLPYDFINARAAEGVAALMALAQRCRISQPPVPLVVTGLLSIDDVELVLKSGASYASGHVGAMGAESGKRALQPEVQRICQILGDLATEADTEQVAQDLQADVTVTYRLLRYVNSPAMGLARSIDSIPQAVVMLGRKELHRWLSVLMLATSEGRKASRALQEISLARARLLEVLAREAGRDPPDALFTVGLLSLMDVIMQVPLPDALQPLRLGPEARQALLERTGPWYDYVALAADLERHDLMAAIDRAKPFGGLFHVMRRAEESWKWAASVQGAAAD